MKIWYVFVIKYDEKSRVVLIQHL